MKKGKKLTTTWHGEEELSKWLNQLQATQPIREISKSMESNWIIYHFEFESLPDWLFGLWLMPEGNYLFGEHKELIDKFKPSTCYVSYEEVAIDELDDFWTELADIITHPIKHFACSYLYEEDLTLEQARDIHRTYYEEQASEALLESEIEKNLFQYLSKELLEHPYVQAVAVEDRWTLLSRAYPRYKVDVLIELGLTDEELVTFEALIEHQFDHLTTQSKTHSCQFVNFYEGDFEAYGYTHRFQKQVG